MEKQARSQRINNEFYDDLEESWYTSWDHPIALLRAENEVRIPWILKTIPSRQKVLDLGCGAGMLANALALEGHLVHGVDLSLKSLQVAKEHDVTQTVVYSPASALSLPYEDSTFDVTCAMDLLEHVEEPFQVIQEAYRVLKPKGLFFFHTFNRNLLSYLVIIKGVDWLVPNAPKNMHIYPLFIKPKELEKMFSALGFTIECLQGFCPQFFSRAFFKLLLKRKIEKHFPFRFSKNLLTGYCGYAKKE